MKDAGAYLGLDFTMIGRFERGTNPIRPSYVRDLIAFYGISHEHERAALLKLQEDAWRKDWWDGNTEDLDIGFLDYTWIEARASHIHVYDPLLVNGLLQTRDYARALTIAGLDEDTPGETIERMISVRMQRQLILNREEPTRLSAVFEESALRRMIGGDETVAGQLGHLTEQSANEHIDIRVIPTGTGWHAGLHGPYTYFKMHDPLPDVVYIESMLGRTFLEDESKVEQYRRAYERLQDVALTLKDFT